MQPAPHTSHSIQSCLEGGGLVGLEGRGVEGDDGGGLSAASCLLGFAPETKKELNVKFNIKV